MPVKGKRVLEKKWREDVISFKARHEVRDAIHAFVEFNSLEREVINSVPFQRLRNIHQLALTSLVYPGATHKRFEHCLGVMDVASKIYDRVFDQALVTGAVFEHVREKLDGQLKLYWRQVIRLAALLHDVGHLPFSHAAEKELLPPGWDHERMTAEIIRHSEIADILSGAKPAISVEDVIDLCWQPSKRRLHEPDRLPDLWSTLLNEVITGDTFGADRVDYLLRDGFHAGVAYGNFDVHRLINGLRVEVDESENLVLAIEYGSIHAAEALLLARYFMYTQVYMHPLRRIYDEHLKDFMAAWLPGNRFSESWKNMISQDDNKVFAAMWEEALGPTQTQLKTFAERIVRRKNFKVAYELNPEHKRVHPTILQEAFEIAVTQFGPERVRSNSYRSTSESNTFRVKRREGALGFGNLDSPDVIGKLPSMEIGLIFVAPEIRDEASALIKDKFRPVFQGRKMPKRRGNG